MSSMADSTLSLLREGVGELGFSLTPRQLDRFQLYYETLLDWNSRINLTAITGYEEVQVRHFLDSLTVGIALLDELSAGKGRQVTAPPGGTKLADIGAGAGFPGLPLKILWPDMQVLLADSVGKKTTFLKELVKLLGLSGVEIIMARAEELGQNKAYRGRFDVATARAVASLPVLCEYCLPLLRVGGWMLAPKKGDIAREVEDATRAARILGGSEPNLHAFQLPGEQEERYVIAINKVAPTPAGYPRRVGLAKSRPL